MWREPDTFLGPGLHLWEQGPQHTSPCPSHRGCGPWMDRGLITHSGPGFLNGTWPHREQKTLLPPRLVDPNWGTGRPRSFSNSSLFCSPAPDNSAKSQTNLSTLLWGRKALISFVLYCFLFLSIYMLQCVEPAGYLGFSPEIIGRTTLITMCHPLARSMAHDRTLRMFVPWIIEAVGRKASWYHSG